jgi:hypothetical protein
MVQKYKIQKKMELFSCIKSLIVLKKYKENISNNRKYSSIKMYIDQLSTQKFFTKIIGTIAKLMAAKNNTCEYIMSENSRFSLEITPMSQQTKNLNSIKTIATPQVAANKKKKDSVSDNIGTLLRRISAKKSAKEAAENKKRNIKNKGWLQPCDRR